MSRYLDPSELLVVHPNGTSEIDELVLVMVGLPKWLRILSHIAISKGLRLVVE